ncbi:MAG: MATE family efflux transporter, partial [Candidatus Aenigmarchaeota archaeon]|nr:MATE family efflux transporter [Candidatus Aenigmarchaeota archaeon]
MNAMKRMKGMREKDLTKGSIFKTLFILATPIILAMSLHTAFNIIDTFFIGMLGSEHLAAISVTFPVVFIFIAIASGLAIGSTALVSQAIGARKKKEANKIAAHSITIALLSGLIVAVAGFLFSPALFSFMGVTGNILAMTIEYANLIFIGFIFLFIGFIAQGIIQADGDTVTPMINMVISIVANIILDPILIFGFGPIPAMGLTGAALATVIGRSIGAFLNIYHLFAGKTSLHMGIESFRLDPSIFKKIFIIGLPSSISNSINSVGMIFIMSLIGGFGTSAIAAFGVGLRLDSVAILPIIGLSHAV